MEKKLQVIVLKDEESTDKIYVLFKVKYSNFRGNSYLEFRSRSYNFKQIKPQ